MMKYTDLLFLGAPLPEDVEKLKWHGDLAHAARRIDKYLEGDLPQAPAQPPGSGGRKCSAACPKPIP